MTDLPVSSGRGGADAPEPHGTTPAMDAGTHVQLEELERLLEEQRPEILRYAYSIFRDWDCAEDVTQRAFLALLETGKNHSSREVVRAFLFKAVRNRSLKVSRRRKTRSRLETPARERLYRPPASPEDAFDEKDRAIRLREALDSLPPRRRRALIMARLHGLSHREIAEQMSLSPQTVANHISLALRDLRRTMGPLLDELVPRDSLAHGA